MLGEIMRFQPQPLIPRFWAKVDKSGGPEACWLWTACKSGFGYGNIWVTNKMKQAHRVAYELFVGPIPAGLCVLHSCDRPLCVNPAHLFLGTYLDNNRDRKMKGRNAPLNGENNTFSKLTWQKVREIRSRYDTTANKTTELAKEYGVHRDTILRIAKKKGWFPDPAEVFNE